MLLQRRTVIYLDISHSRGCAYKKPACGERLEHTSYGSRQKYDIQARTQCLMPGRLQLSMQVAHLNMTQSQVALENLQGSQLGILHDFAFPYDNPAHSWAQAEQWFGLLPLEHWHVMQIDLPERHRSKVIWLDLV